MIRELFRKIISKAPSFNFGSKKDETFRGIKGEVFWELRDPDGNLLEKGHHKNIVTLDASILLARLCKTPTSTAHQSEPSFGIFALAVGTGDVGWNTNNPPAATNTQRSLYNEIARKKIATSTFVTSNGSVSSSPTNIVDFTTTFSESEAVGGICEMGLIGGDNSTNMNTRNPALPANGTYDPTLNLTNLDTLVNYVSFPVINKPATSTLSWTWRLSF